MMMIDVDPVENTQAQLEKAVAFLELFIEQYGYPSQKKIINKRDKELIEINLCTLYGLLYDIHADLSKAIHSAYR